MSFFSLITGSFYNTDTNRGVFVETQPWEKGFAVHYEKNLKPHIYKFENLRIDALKTASRRVIVSIPLLLILFIGLFFVMFNQNLTIPDDAKMKIFAAVMFAAGSGAYLWINSSLKKYSNSIKSDIFPNIISFVGNYKYSATCAKSVSVMQSSEIIPPYDRETNEDAISGIYKTVNIDLFESNLEERRRSKNHTYYVSVFKGIVITLSMHKNFKGKTIVRRDSGVIGNWFKEKFSSLENVKLEDPRFEKIFEVYTTDQIEARYLLTTAFMERLMELSEAFGGKGMECSFYDNNLLIMIPVKRNLFEPGSIYKSEDFVDDAKSLINEMRMIFQIIDVLKLDQNIGM